MTNDIRPLFGELMDAEFSDMNFRQVRYLGHEGALLPAPLQIQTNPTVWDLERTPLDEFLASDNQDQEYLDTWRVTCGKDNLKNSLGAEEERSREYDAFWEISDDGGTTWIPVRNKQRAKSDVARWEFIMVERGGFV